MANKLFRRRLDTWRGRQRGDRPPVTFAYGSSVGRFEIRPEWPKCQLHAAVYLDGRRIGTSADPRDAARDLASGRFDTQLGFLAADHAVPAKLDAWTVPARRKLEAA